MLASGAFTGQFRGGARNGLEGGTGEKDVRKKGEAMKAGRELDALVAEKVMGWTYRTFPDGACPLVKHWYCGEQYMLMKSFSTSITDAWQVVEKLNNLWQGHWSLVRVDGEWAIYENPYDIEGYPPTAQAMTAPLAICLAALKAVGVGVPE